MKSCFVYALAFTMLGFTTGALAETGAMDEHSGEQSDQQARCQISGRIFHRLAEQREGGADPQAAASRVSRWLSELGKTGSHVEFDYRKSVAAATPFVFQHKELNPPALSAFGFRSCELQHTFAADELKRDASLMLLLDAAKGCQEQFPGDKYNNSLRECMKEKSQAITQRVRTARIQREQDR